jgi:hypothetical protein
MKWKDALKLGAVLLCCCWLVPLLCLLNLIDILVYYTQ